MLSSKKLWVFSLLFSYLTVITFTFEPFTAQATHKTHYKLIK